MFILDMETVKSEQNQLNKISIIVHKKVISKPPKNIKLKCSEGRKQTYTLIPPVFFPYDLNRT